MKNQTTLKADNYFVAFAKLTGVGVAAIAGLALLQKPPAPAPQPQVATPITETVNLAHYQRDPIHGYPVDAWKYLKGAEQQRALAEHCKSHLVYRDYAPECVR